MSAEAARHFRRAGDLDHAVLDADGVGAGVEQVRGQLLDLVAQAFRRAHRDRAADHALAAAARAGAIAGSGGIVLETVTSS